MLKFEYRLTEQDYLKAQSAHIRSYGILYWFSWLVSLCLLVIGLLWLLTPSEHQMISVGIALVLVSAAVLTNPEPTINLFQRFRVHQLWKQNVLLHQASTAEASKVRLAITTLNASSQVDWQVLVKFLETPHLFLVYQLPQLFYVFPKRAFANVSQIEEFRSLLQTNIRPQSR